MNAELNVKSMNAAKLNLDKQFQKFLLTISSVCEEQSSFFGEHFGVTQ